MTGGHYTRKGGRSDVRPCCLGPGLDGKVKYSRPRTLFGTVHLFAAAVSQTINYCLYGAVSLQLSDGTSLRDHEDKILPSISALDLVRIEISYKFIDTNGNVGGSGTHLNLSKKPEDHGEIDVMFSCAPHGSVIILIDGPDLLALVVEHGSIASGVPFTEETSSLCLH